MAIECGVIALMLLGMSILFFTRKHKEMGWATLPLTLVPLTNFVVLFILVRTLHMEISLYVGILILLCAVAVSCAWVGFASNGLKHKGTRLTYITISLSTISSR